MLGNDYADNPCAEPGEGETERQATPRFRRTRSAPLRGPVRATHPTRPAPPRSRTPSRRNRAHRAAKNLPRAGCTAARRPEEWRRISRGRGRSCGSSCGEVEACPGLPGASAAPRRAGRGAGRSARGPWDSLLAPVERGRRPQLVPRPPKVRIVFRPRRLTSGRNHSSLRTLLPPQPPSPKPLSSLEPDLAAALPEGGQGPDRRRSGAESRVGGSHQGGLHLWR